MFTLTLDAPVPGAARLRLAGHLDDAGARQVLHAAADVARCGCSRLVVDLGGLSSWDDAAAFAVVGCTRLARWLPDGVQVVPGGAAGRRLVASLGVQEHPDRPWSAATRSPTGAEPATMAPCPAC